MTFAIFAALVLLLLNLALLVTLWLRRPPPAPVLELPPEITQQLPQRLHTLELALQATQLAVAKNDGALGGIAQQLSDFTHSTRSLLDESLAKTAQESRTNRSELQAAFTALQTLLEQHLSQARTDVSEARREQIAQLTAFRNELAHTAQNLTTDSQQSRELVSASTQSFGLRIQERFDTLTSTLSSGTRETFDSLKGDIHTQLVAMSTALKEQLNANTRQLTGLVTSQQQDAQALRNALNERLTAIQQDNAAKLEAMRQTVDEKLHATLEQRLGESFKLVSDRLEQVHKGLGEMQTLAGSVGDLKRVMTNVKTRGTWGELQLGAIIENVLTPEQYARNVKTRPDSNDLVEFAIRLPGKIDEQPVWLPIDSKYPVEHYQRLLDAHDAVDKAAIAAAGNALETSIKLEARKIADKYLAPPHTTDFAILYLPTESLFAEVLRRPGLVEAVQNECRIVITGPANLAAMLNSLQMGFKTLAIEKRSSEVWKVLGQVKTEFKKFGEVVEATRKSIDTAAKKFEQVGVRTRAIERQLREVQELPLEEDEEQLLLEDV